MKRYHRHPYMMLFIRHQTAWKILVSVKKDQLVNKNWFRRFETRKREKRGNSYFWFLKLLYIDNVIIFRLYFVLTFHLLWLLKICKLKYTVIYTIYCYSFVKRNMFGELFDYCLSHTWYYTFFVLFLIPQTETKCAWDTKMQTVFSNRNNCWILIRNKKTCLVVKLKIVTPSRSLLIANTV